MDEELASVVEQHDAELESVNLRLRIGDDRMNNMETLIKENTGITQNNQDTLKEIKEILDLGKSFFKILHYLGVAFKWIAGLAAAVGALAAAWHNLPPPGK
jgi:hypothetical protein